MWIFITSPQCIHCLEVNIPAGLNGIKRRQSPISVVLSIQDLQKGRLSHCCSVSAVISMFYVRREESSRSHRFRFFCSLEIRLTWNPPYLWGVIDFASFARWKSGLPEIRLTCEASSMSLLSLAGNPPYLKSASPVRSNGVRFFRSVAKDGEGIRFATEGIRWAK